MDNAPTEKAVAAKGDGWLDIMLSGLFIATISALLTLALFPLYQRVYPPRLPPPPQLPTIITIDTETLIAEAIAVLGQQMRDDALPAEELPVRTQAFTRALFALLDDYADEGMLVLSTDAFFATPKSVEDFTSRARTTLRERGYLGGANTGEKAIHATAQ